MRDGCFHFLDIMNNAAMDICVKVLFGHMLSFSRAYI